MTRRTIIPPAMWARAMFWRPCTGLRNDRGNVISARPTGSKLSGMSPGMKMSGRTYSSTQRNTGACPYAYAKVFILQALDCLFRTDMFTRRFTLTPLPYCSQMWAQACADAGVLRRVNGKEPDSVQPDDWDDESLKRPDVWKTVLEHDGKTCTIHEGAWKA